MPIVVVLPVPLTPDDEDHRRGGPQVDGVGLGARGVGQQLGEPPGQVGAARELPGAGLGLQPTHDAGGGGGAHVGLDQHLLQALPRLLVERLEDRRLELGPQGLPALLQVLAQPTEEAAALLAVGHGRRGRPVGGQEELRPGARHPRARYCGAGRAPGSCGPGGGLRYAAAAGSRPGSRRETTFDTPSAPMLTP